jgi:endoglucanase
MDFLMAAVFLIAIIYLAGQGSIGKYVAFFLTAPAADSGGGAGAGSGGGAGAGSGGGADASGGGPNIGSVLGGIGNPPASASEGFGNMVQKWFGSSFGGK